MFKKVCLIACVAITAPTWADVEGGFWITSHKATDAEAECSPSRCNGKSFYISNQPLNWWSAWTWCQANGGTLASLKSMCPDAVGYPNNATCYNLKGITSLVLWSDIPYGERAIVFSGGYDQVKGFSKVTGGVRAACEI